MLLFDQLVRVGIVSEGGEVFSLNNKMSATVSSVNDYS